MLRCAGKAIDPRPFMRDLISNFGMHTVVMMASAYFGVKGCLYSFNGLVLLPFLRSMGVTGRDYQVLGAASRAPFAMKALFGAVSDSLPLFGYHKASYIVLSAILGSFSYLLLGSFSLSASVAVILFFMCNVELAVVDLLCEGKYAELMRGKPESGSTMVTWVWVTYHVGSLFAALVTGPVADSGNIAAVFWICMPLAAQVCVPVYLGWLKDPRLPEGERGIRKEKLKKHPRVFMISIAMALCAMGQAVVNLNYRSQPVVLFAYSATVSCGLIVAAFWGMPPKLARANLFLFLDSVVYIQIGGALDYWFLAEDDCLPGGPAFDYTYYSTYTRIVGSIAAMLGVTLFQSIMGGWKIRSIFVVTTVMRCLAGLFDIVMVNRINITLGISDKAMYMLGDAIIYEVAYMMNFMPVVVLISKLCPKDMESTTYAVLAGFANFGQQVSSTLGVMMISQHDIKTEVPCQWGGLTAMILWAHVIIPTATVIPLSYVLIPDAKMTDDLTAGLFADAPATGEAVLPSVPHEDATCEGRGCDDDNDDDDDAASTAGVRLEEGAQMQPIGAVENENAVGGKAEGDTVRLL